ncbi:MAG: hypothetical protein Q7R65_00685, partial [bacterium]|nr:hypothetical protein [bacterium]
MKFEIGPIPEGKKSGWTVLVNGKLLPTPVQTVRLVSSRFGELMYGLRPEGYDSWVYREPQGGGEVTIPYVFTPEGELLVGLLREARANMG